MPDIAAWVALSLTNRIGSKTLRALLEHFGTLDAVLAADAVTLRKVRGIGPKIAQAILAVDVAQVKAAVPRWQAAGVSIITLQDEHYPARLRDIDDTPPTLFMRGDWHEAYSKAVAVVGTRSPSTESLSAARRLGAELAQRGYTIVSGLALGVDTAAHMGALDANGSTVAVLGCGVLNVYPEVNRLLAQTILEREAGVLLCEVHPHATPAPANLVVRNRLISGLCEAVIVVETDIDGGAMYAAKRALEQGRRVYALDNAASGNRALIESGAAIFDVQYSEFIL